MGHRQRRGRRVTAQTQRPGSCKSASARPPLPPASPAGSPQPHGAPSTARRLWSQAAVRPGRQVGGRERWARTLRVGAVRAPGERSRQRDEPVQRPWGAGPGAWPGPGEGGRGSESRSGAGSWKRQEPQDLPRVRRGWGCCARGWPSPKGVTWEASVPKLHGRLCGRLTGPQPGGSLVWKPRLTLKS